MYVDRLNKLADYLETVPRGKFNLNLWHGGYKDFNCQFNEENNPELYQNLMKAVYQEFPEDPFIRTGEMVPYGNKMLEVIEPAQCKTAGCAFGWAPSVPGFKELGLRMVLVKDIPEHKGYL